MTESEFRALGARGYNRVPLVIETFADLDTPLSVYLKLANAPYTYLLESVQGGERFGRYSFIGLPASARIEVRGRECTEYQGDAIVERRTLDDPLDYVARYRDRFKPFVPEGLPRFCGGLLGYFGYDCVRYFEHKLAAAKPDPLATPDIELLVSTELAVVDNLKGKLYFSDMFFQNPAAGDEV